jgi:hypothetical protein
METKKLKKAKKQDHCNLLRIYIGKAFSEISINLPIAALLKV